MQCSFLGLSFLSIVYSYVDIDMDAHNNYTGDIKTKRIHQMLSLENFGAAYGCRRTEATSEVKEIYRGSLQHVQVMTMSLRYSPKYLFFLKMFINIFVVFLLLFICFKF